MNFFTRPTIEDRSMVQYSSMTITLSGQTNISNLGQFIIQGPILDFTGTTTASTLYTVAGVSGYVNYGNVSSFKIQPPTIIQSGVTSATTVDVTGYILSSLDADGNIIWSQPVNVSISGFTYNDANKLTILNNNGSEYSIYLNQFSGLTINGSVSATTFYGDGSNLTGLVSNDFYVTGGTYSNGALTLNRQNGSVTITGLTTPFTGNTSGDCITDLYVSNLNSCSPLHIQPNNVGDVYIGENGGVNVGIGNNSPLSRFHLTGNALIDGDVNITGNVNIIGTATTLNTETVQTRDNKILLNYSGTNLTAIGGGIEVLSAKTDGNNVSLTTDVNGDWNSNTGLNITGRTIDSTTNGLTVKNNSGTDNLVVRNDGYVGIGTSTPSYLLDIVSGTSKLYYNPQSLGGRVELLGSDMPRFDVGKVGVAGASFGIRVSSNPTTVGYGQYTDTFLYASATSNGLNLINMPGGGDDYIRFYAGLQATSPSHVHIQGNGLTQGYVGIGIENPTEKLHVSGNTKISGGLNIGTIGSGSPLINLGLDSNGNIVTGTTGGNTFTGGLTATSINTNSLIINGITYTAITDTFVTGFTYNDANRLTISRNQGQPDLNVFINTFSGLTVNGNALINGDVNILGNVNVIGTATTLNTQVVQTRDNKILLNYSGTNLTAIGGGIEVLSAKTDGNNVSLTTDVNGDWNSNTGLNVVGRTNDDTSYGLNIQNSDGTSNFVFRNDGYVGIGTASPTQKLHVSGNTRLENTVNGDLYTIIVNNNIGGSNTRSLLGQRVVSSSGGTTLTGLIATSGYETDLSVYGFGDGGAGYLKNCLTITVAGDAPRGDINIGTRDSNKFLRFFSGNQNFDKTSLRGSLNSSGYWGFGTNMTGQTSTVDIMGNNGYNQLRLRTSYTPTTSGDTNGNVGDISWDNNYLYIKTNNGWGRALLNYSF